MEIIFLLPPTEWKSFRSVYARSEISQGGSKNNFQRKKTDNSKSFFAGITFSKLFSNVCPQLATPVNSCSSEVTINTFFFLFMEIFVFCQSQQLHGDASNIHAFQQLAHFKFINMVTMCQVINSRAAYFSRDVWYEMGCFFFLKNESRESSSSESFLRWKIHTQCFLFLLTAAVNWTDISDKHHPQPLLLKSVILQKEKKKLPAIFRFSQNL